MNFKKIVLALAAIAIAIGAAQYLGLGKEQTQNLASQAEQMATGQTSQLSQLAAEATSKINTAAGTATQAVNEMAQDTSAAINSAVASANTSSSNIIASAASNGSFKTFSTLVAAAGLTDTLSGPGPFTVFAPTDAAFAKLPAETLANLQLPTSKAQLQQILSYHVISGKLPSSEWAGKTSSPKSVAGLNLNIDGNSNTINGAKIASNSISASNGMIYSIDTVLLPPSSNTPTN